MLNREKKNTAPHIAIVRFNVLVHRLLPDGSIDPQIIDCSDLFKDHKMAQQAEFTVEGFDKWDCAKKLKKVLDKLGEK